jgi:hypothetical protein
MPFGRSTRNRRRRSLGPRQILRLGPAAGDDRQGPEQAFLLLLEERLERGRLRVDHVLGRVHGCLPRRPKVGDISHL